MRARRLLGLGAAASLLAILTACSAPTPTALPSPSPTATTAPSSSAGATVAFYGDSYTRGMGATSSDKRWSTILSTERGWVEINRAENGLGFVNRRDAMGPGLNDIPAIIIADDPDIVIVTMGLNDNFSYETAADQIEQNIDSDLERMRDGLPDARIVVVEPFWWTAERPASVDIITGWVEDAAERIGADYIDGASHWLDGHYADSAASYMASDGLHPDDTGYAYIAERMDAALRELDPPL